MADQQETLANFTAITDCDDVRALGLLEASDWKLEEAVNLFYASNAASGSGPGAGGGPSAADPHDEEVRAPIAPVVDRLVDTPMHVGGRGYAMAPRGPYGLASSSRPHVSVFEDFEAASSSAHPTQPKTTALSGLFQAPKGLLFQVRPCLAQAWCVCLSCVCCSCTLACHRCTIEVLRDT